MNFFKKIFTAFLIFFTINACSSSGSSGGSTPLDIPAPVSHLSISSPDNDGLARVTGEAGAVDNLVTVTITNVTNPNAGATLIKKQVSPVALTSNQDGSFQTNIYAAAGDSVRVLSTKDSSILDETIIVPEATWALPLNLNFTDLVYNPDSGEIIILANDAIDGFLYFLNPADGSYTTRNLAGLSGAAQIDLVTSSQILVIRDSNDNANIYHHHIPANNTLNDPSNNVSSLAASPNDDFAILGHNIPSPSFSFYNVAADLVTPLEDIEDLSANPQINTHLVATDLNNNTTIAAFVSQITAGYLLSHYSIDAGIPAADFRDSFVLSGVGIPNDLILFNGASEVLISDSGLDQVLRYNLSSEELEAINTEATPNALTINASDTCAFVIQNTDRLLGLIDLTANSLLQIEALGLNPAQIASDPTGINTDIFILNAGDNTIQVVESDC